MTADRHRPGQDGHGATADPGPETAPGAVRGPTANPGPESATGRPAATPPNPGPGTAARAPGAPAPAGPGPSPSPNPGASHRPHRDAPSQNPSPRRPAPAPSPESPAEVPPRALVVTASNRAAAGVYPDKGGPLLAEGLAALGFAVDGPRVVPDGEPVETALRAAVTAGYDVVLTTGGTGISPTDRTPDVTRRVIDYEVPGIPEAIRAAGRAKVPTAALSRGLAGVAGRTLIINLPGSTGGVRDGLAVLADLLPHAADQLRGGDHGPTPTPTPAPPDPTSTGSAH